jgi:hypothetical protein
MIAVLVALITATTLLGAEVSRAAADDKFPIRDPRCDIPVLAPWAPGTDSSAEPGGYREYIDMIAEHSDYTIIGADCNRLGRDRAYQRQYMKEAAAYAKGKGIGLALYVSIQHFMGEFAAAYPAEMQERLDCKEVDLLAEGKVEANGRGRLLRAYSYIRRDGMIEAGTVEDITPSCTGQGTVSIPCSEKTRGRKACLMFAEAVPHPALFSPHIAEFQEKIIREWVVELGCVGSVIDEGGLPTGLEGGPNGNFYWYSKPMAEVYAKETGGRDLLRDYLLMWRGEAGREQDRDAAMNRYMELILRGYVLIEDGMYQATKRCLGPKAYVGYHPTWHSFPTAGEATRNGMDWWAATRDFGQTDECAPYCIRTALSKKWPGPVWYNMYYAPDPKEYEPLLWRYALGGGRLSFHPAFILTEPETRPGRTAGVGNGAQEPLLRGRLMRGEVRVRLLNYVTKTPLDCPVAVVFGHPAAMNWTWPGYMQFGLHLADDFWLAGYYADLIPTSEIHNGSLTIDEEGYVRYGKQRYSAVVLYHPQFDKPVTAEFFRKAAAGKTALYRIGDWTIGFDGKPVDMSAALPRQMIALPELIALPEENVAYRSHPRVAASFYPETMLAGRVKARVKEISEPAGRVVARLKEIGVQPQTPAERYTEWLQICQSGFQSVQPPASGMSRLIDGTRVCVAGTNDAAGDPIQMTIKVDGHDVTFDAVGVAAVRLDKDGKLEAMAAGGLRHFKAGPVEIKLDQPADVALWRDTKGVWQGVLQDYEGEVPKDLAALCKHWTRLQVPEPLKE